MSVERILVALVALSAVSALVVATLTQQEVQNASISVSSREVEPGDAIEVTGTCTPDTERQQIPIVLRGNLDGGQLAEVETDESGEFSTTVEIPEISSPGSGELVARCGIDDNPRVALSVAEPEEALTSLSVDPQTAEPGETIDVWGTCTARSDREEVPITLRSGSGNNSLGEIDSGASGDFSDTIRLPEGLSTGSGTLAAECGLGSDVDPDTELTIAEPAVSPVPVPVPVPSPVPSPAPVPEPSIAVEPSTVEAGNSIDVTGTCTEYSDQALVPIVLGGDIEGGQLDVVSTEDTGNFATTIGIPRSAPTGEGILFAGCGLGSNIDPRTTLTITAPARETSIEVTPSTVESGGTIEVVGTCTQRSDEEEVGILLGGGIEGGSLDVVEPDANGDFATTIELSENGATGTGTLFAACGLGDDDPRTTLTITAPVPEPSISVSPQTVEAGQTIEVSGTCTTRSDEEEVAIVLGGDIEGGQLDVVEPDANGDFATTIEIPADSPTGEGTLFAACGLGSDNDPRTSLTIVEADEPQDELLAIQRGDSGGMVTLWQYDLNEWLSLSDSDFGPVPADGTFGPDTEEATRIFQDSNDNVETDLVVNEDDRREIEEAIERLEE